MQELTERLEEAVRAAARARPDTDAVTLGTALIDRSGVGDVLDRQWECFGAATTDLVRAHGHWSSWHDEAGALCNRGPADVTQAFLELFEHGWVTTSHTFPFAVVCWRRARVEPTPAMTARASERAQQAFHTSRLHDHEMAPPTVSAELQRWSGWSDSPEVSQWMQVARRALPHEDACDATRPWALFTASRQAHLNGWPEESRRLFELAEEHANDERSRFVVAFIRTMRAVMRHDPSGPTLVDALMAEASDEADELMALQTRAELERRTSADLQAAAHGLHLARRLGVPSRELHFLLLMAYASLADASKLRTHMDAATFLVEQRGASHPSYGLLMTQLHLVEGDFPAAYDAALAELAKTGITAQAVRGPTLAIATATAHLTRQDPAPYLAEARRLLIGTEHAGYLRWAEQVLEHGAGSVHPLPFIENTTCRVASDGSWFQVHGVRKSLADSALARTLVASLAREPHASDTLIEAVWPGDASSFLSLKNRLHALIRSVRRAGLGEHLVFEGGRYALVDVEVVAP